MRLDFTRPLLECWTGIAGSKCHLDVAPSEAYANALLLSVLDRENVLHDSVYDENSADGLRRLYERVRSRMVAPTQTVNTCHCGESYTGTRWLGLEFVGLMGDLELRNCVCGSTRAIPLKDFASPTLAQGAHGDAPDHQRVTGGSTEGRAERTTFGPARSEAINGGMR